MISQITLSDLEAFAATFWNAVGDARVFAFEGPMGAGKTTIIEALCREKGVQDAMGSPTYSIINEYAYTENGQSRTIYHIDLYRLNDEAEIMGAGVEDAVYSGATCFVEWPQKAPALFDEKTVWVYIEPIGAERRSVKLAIPV